MGKIISSASFNNRSIENADSVENNNNNERQRKRPESLARFDSISGFKDFFNKSKEDIISFQNQIKQKQKTQKANEGLLHGRHLEETNATIDKDIQEIQEKVSALQNNLDEYSEAARILELIKQKQKTQKANEGLLHGRHLEETNAAIDKDIAELNRKLEEMVVKKEEGREMEMRKKAMEDKEMLYKTRIDLREDISEEEKAKLKEKVKFVNKENVKEICEKEIKNLVELSYNKEDKTKNKEYKARIKVLSEQIGLPQREIQKLINAQKTNLEDSVYQQKKIEKSRKESKWKKIRRLLPKIAFYGGGTVLGILTGGTFAVVVGASMSAFRVAETIFKSKKESKAQEAAILESKKMLLGEIDEIDMSEKEKKEEHACLETFYDNIFIALSVAKQNQIENKEKEFSELGKKITEAEEGYKPGRKESKEKLQKLYAERREAHKAQIKKYLEAQGLEGEDLDKRIKLSAQLVELEDNQNIMELDFAKRKARKINKIFNKLDKILSHPAFLGGARGASNQNKEKLITATIFAVAGILARICPVVRNTLMAYAGMKFGSAAASFFVSREDKELLRQVSAEDIGLNSSPDDITKAKAQLLDVKYKEANPAEYAKLQEKIFAIDRAKMETLLGKAEGDEDGGYIGETNKRLEEIIKKRRAVKRAHKGMKIFLGAAGAAAGWFIGDYIADKMQKRKDNKALSDELDKKLDQEIKRANAEFLEKQRELAVVGKGEGVEHPIIRQLRANPEKYGFNGDATNADAIDDWVKSEAHRIAIKNGYVKIGGGQILNETRVNQAGKVAYVLEQKNGQNIVREVNLSGEEIGTSGQVNAHEYVYKPGALAGKEAAPAGIAQEGEKLTGTSKVVGTEGENLSSNWTKNLRERWAEKFGKTNRTNMQGAEGVVKDSPSGEGVATSEGVVPEGDHATNMQGAEGVVKDSPSGEGVATTKPEVTNQILHARKENIPGGHKTIALELGSLRGSTGKEVLSSDWIKKLMAEPGTAKFDKLRASATLHGRALFMRLQNYRKLLDENHRDEARALLESIHKELNMMDRLLGKGVIDRSKFPSLEE